ncbi:multicopper oxidase domain-containing protein [Cohnella yongneupensis]|uniref:Multicopper oxidase domain-containing protein n=1 Tax=Cohnella yongneupensis TaxID=425006 RepID=A0ABW0R1S3_9BACL
MISFKNRALWAAVASAIVAAVIAVAITRAADRPSGNDAQAAEETAVAQQSGTTTGEVKSFHLYATDGYLTLPGGESVYVWGYSLNNEQGTAVYPAPTLEVNEGDQVEVTLTNIGPAKTGIKRLAHTIHFHGLDVDQANDGVPETSQALLVGDSFTYRFTATHAGTYFYHCHVDTVEHLQMGMHGAFIVNAKDGVKTAWTGGPAYDKEYVMELNEIDPVWHKAVENGEPYDRTIFHPTYFTINGKAFPDTGGDPTTEITGDVGDHILVRLINAGYQPHSMHLHGHHFEVIASDGRPLEQRLDKDTIEIAPGERYDLLITFTQSGTYPFHSHTITDNMNNGVYPGGIHTMVDIAPADDANAVGVKKIGMKLDQPSATIDGKAAPMNVAPRAVDNTAYVPLNFIVQQLGGEVTPSETDGSIIYANDKTSIQMWSDRDLVVIDGRASARKTPLIDDQGIMLIALPFVSDMLGAGAKADYDAKSGDITIAAVPVALPVAKGMAGMDHGDHSDGGEVSSPDVSGIVVSMKDMLFAPVELKVKVGDTVTWVNDDPVVHSLADLGGAFDSGSIPPGGTWSYTFKDQVTYDYYCSIHPLMTGKLIVE